METTAIVTAILCKNFKINPFPLFTSASKWYPFPKKVGTDFSESHHHFTPALLLLLGERCCLNVSHSSSLSSLVVVGCSKGVLCVAGVGGDWKGFFKGKSTLLLFYSYITIFLVILWPLSLPVLPYSTWDGVVISPSPNPFRFLGINQVMLKNEN